MAALADSAELDIGNHQLEYRLVGPRPGDAPTLILLHEGLGCVGLWGDFPDKLAAATQCGVFAYSRAGYGKSSTITLPRPLSYMHEEAQKILPQVLRAIGFRRGFLIGHSDGASIAAIYAGSVQDHRVRGITLIASHFFVEEKGIVEIAKAKVAYEKGELRSKLARWHTHVDAAFLGWNGAWLDPNFRRWDITGFLPFIRCPVQVIQGEDDQYGTQAQVRVAREKCHSPVDAVMLAGVQHSPHREAAELTVSTIAGFVARLAKTGVAEK